MEVEKEELVMAMESSGEVESLHKPIYQKDGNEIQLMDKLEETGAQEEKVLNQMLLAQLLEGLEKEERQLIYLRYFANQTQSQVGKTLGISQVQVSRLAKKDFWKKFEGRRLIRIRRFVIEKVRTRLFCIVLRKNDIIKCI